MNAEKPVSKNTHVMCRCSLTVLIFAGASHAVLLVCQSTSNVLPVIRNGKDCYSFPVFKVFLPGRNCCSRFYQCRLIQNEYLKKQSKEWLQTECINTQNAPFKSDPFSAVSVSQTGACQRYLTMAAGQSSSAIHSPLTTLTLKTQGHRRVT